MRAMSNWHKTSSSVVEVARLMAWRQATSPLKISTWSGGCQLLENVWRRHFPTWSGGNLLRWSCLPPSHQFDYFHNWGWCFYGCQLVIARIVVSLTFGQHLNHPIVYITHPVWARIKFHKMFPDIQQWIWVRKYILFTESIVSEIDFGIFFRKLHFSNFLGPHLAEKHVLHHYMIH